MSSAVNHTDPPPAWSIQSAADRGLVHPAVGLPGADRAAAIGMNTNREILDVKGAAQVLGCSVAHVSNMLNGKVAGVPPMPHVRAGRLRLIRRGALMRWFERTRGSLRRQ